MNHEPPSITLARLMKNPPASMSDEEIVYFRGLVHSMGTLGYNQEDVEAMYNLSTDGMTSWHSVLARVATRMGQAHERMTTPLPKKPMGPFKAWSITLVVALVVIKLFFAGLNALL